MALRGKWVAGRLQIWDGAYSAIGGKGVDFGNVNSSAYLHGGGTSTYPLVYATAGNFMSYYVSGSAASGTYRGLYQRLYLTGGAGGEAVRAYCTVSSNTPADTVNGVHASLSFGASAGNVTGAGNAARCTFHVPNRAITGTCSAINAELYADGTSSDVTGNLSFIRATLGGNATGAAAVEDDCALLRIDGGTNASGNLVGGVGNEPTWTSNTYLIRCNLNGTVAYLVAVSV